MRIQFTQKDWDTFPIKWMKKEMEGEKYLNIFHDDLNRPIYSPIDIVDRYINLSAHKENKKVLDNFFSQF